MIKQALQRLTINRNHQYLVYYALGLVTAAFTYGTVLLSGSAFQRFIGEFNPLLVVLILAVLGALLLSLLSSTYGFFIVRGVETLRGIAKAFAFASIMAFAIIIADFIIIYPQDTNIQWPVSLLFYPAIAFVAEIIFLIIPLTLLVFLLQPLSIRLGEKRIILIAVLAAAAVEPVYQTILAGKHFSVAKAYTWIHIYVLSLLQFYIFLRYDFVCMYLFRLLYYIYWHVVWGAVRLEVLF